MSRKGSSFVILGLGCLLMILLSVSCSSKKNTAFSRWYHSVNTRYNVHFNANEAFKESMKSKEKQQEQDDNLSRILYIYPEILDSADLKFKETFTTTIDKSTKAIKMHSIKTRPRRDPDRRGDKEYQQWVKRKEFNPFLVNSWMLLAKSEFEEGNYLRAITTFMYITKIYEYDPEIVSEAKLWIARSYSEMGWRYEAENALRKMEQNNEIHPDLQGMYAAVKANALVRNESYSEAIPFLQNAIAAEKNGSQKRRKRYLLGQLYEEMGDNTKAYQAYKDVRGLNAPYNYVINSKLRQIAVSGLSEQQTVSELKKLTKGSKNEDYFDLIYSTLGDVYLNSMDTLQAIESYSLAVNKSKKNGYDKALAHIKLGGLHFERKEYVQAQPHYSLALSQIKKNDSDYGLVSLRSEVLDQLVVHAKVVYEQDSLLALAAMPEVDRIAIIEDHIKELKKAEELKRKEEELAKRKEEYSQPQYTGWDDLGKMQNSESEKPVVIAPDKTADFYFYNPKMVEQGKLTFQQKWGKRSLADDWRRKSKESIDPSEEGEKDADVLLADGQLEGQATVQENRDVVTDIHSVEYYLQQLPMTDEAKNASYALIEDGLFNMGLIYKNLLEDKLLAIDAFETNLKRFPGTPNKEEIYYQLFLIYLQMDNDPLMTLYRNLIVNEFSEGKYAIPLRDENYAWNFKYMAKLQEDLYQEAYQAYIDGNVSKVRQNYESIQTKYPFVSLMPKFALLNALSYAQTKDAAQLEKNLKKLIADYPQSDVIPLASGILKNIKDGMILLSDGTPIVGMDWTMAYSNDSVFEGDQQRIIAYHTDLEKPHTLLLMFKPNTIDRNELLYQVADYNFSNYVVQTYDLAFDDNPVLSALEITGFENFQSIKSYVIKAMDEDGLIAQIESGITPVPISTSNHTDVFPRLGLEQYMVFYADSLGNETPKLLAHWGQPNTELLAQAEETVVPETVEQNNDKNQIIIPETGEHKITFPELAVQAQKQAQEQNEKEINLEDVLSKEQTEGISNALKKHDEVIDALQGVIDNPADGLKNIFNRKNLEENLTKEEKEELKKQQKEEKERQKELVKMMKAKEDSVQRVEKFKADSISQAAKIIQDSIQTTERLRQQQIDADRKERQRLQKEEEKCRQQEQQEKENTRKQQLKEREERRKQQERDRRELQRQREQERERLQKEREDERRKREKEAEEQRKQRERERQELIKQQGKK